MEARRREKEKKTFEAAVAKNERRKETALKGKRLAVQDLEATMFEQSLSKLPKLQQSYYVSYHFLFS